MTAVMLSLFCVSASANAPMMPDIIIKLDQPYDGDYVVAVLSNRNAFDAFDEKYDYLENNSYKGENDLAALYKLRSVNDEDGYNYIADLDPYNNENESTDLPYNYDTFKIALYFPDTDTLVKTDILKKENYIEVFKLTLDEQKIADVQTAEYQEDNNSANGYSEGKYHPAVTTEKPTIFSSAVLIRFLICLAINLVIEILIGLAFGYCKWQHILTIAVTNIITLILLTVSVWLINPPVYNGLLSFPFAFFELAVAAVEGAVYAILFRRFEYREKYLPWLAFVYAFFANLVTYVIGSLFNLI